MNNRYFLVLVCTLLLSATSFAQNVSSPYSILGIGDIETVDFGRYSGSGDAAVSRREPNFYNFVNPASLTAMPYKAINFDFGFRGRASQFKVPGVDTLTQASKDFTIKRATLAFKVRPNLAFAFGLRPYSTSNYQYLSGSLASNGINTLLKSADGSGGIYQSYFSVAKEFNKHVSVGVTASWLFGAMQNSIEYIDPTIGLDIKKNENDFYNAAGLQVGLQYYSKQGKKFQHTFGFTAAAFTQLKGPSTTNYTSGTTVIDTLPNSRDNFKLPISFSAGYSIANRHGLSLHLQGNYDKWPTQILLYQNSFTKDCYRLHAGMEYSKKKGPVDAPFELYYLAWGLKMEQSYMLINNNRINTYAGTFGIGKNLSRFLSASAGIEGGIRGVASLGQIQENYFQFNVGFTLKDIWFGARKFGRYN